MRIGHLFCLVEATRHSQAMQSRYGLDVHIHTHTLGKRQTFRGREVLCLRVKHNINVPQTFHHVSIPPFGTCIRDPSKNVLDFDVKTQQNHEIDHAFWLMTADEHAVCFSKFWFHIPETSSKCTDMRIQSSKVKNESKLTSRVFSNKPSAISFPENLPTNS